ncbi:MAG: HAD-IC family P-type ATPase, partial [Terriglobia bacterium]|nr:HAD-IC family P-type ATPase [Terriglobia bacterium]
DVKQEAAEVRRRIGYVPQLLSADGELTGYENLLLSTRLYLIPHSERERRISEALSMMGLKDFRDQLVGSYSGGMIRRLEIAQSTLHRDFWDKPLPELFQLLQTSPAGMTTEEATRRLRLYGPNTLVAESRFTSLLSFFGFFANPLVIILVVASGVSLALGEHLGGLIIITIVLFSVILNFSMEFQARHAVEEIQKQIAITAVVIRDGGEQELPTAQLVPGDIIRLKAGDLVPADARLLEVKDLHVRESVLTGESLPVEKTPNELPSQKHGVAEASNSVFLGTAVQTGIATAVVVCTGKDTVCGGIAHRLAMRPPETEFGRGVRRFGMMLTWVTMLLVLFVLLVNIIFHRPVMESFLFSVALAVGMTPEMMPMIITVTLAQGAKRMTRK